MGAIGFVKKTYDLLSTADSVSGKITSLIKSSELSKQDHLNFRALERRLNALREPLQLMIVHK